MGSILVTGVPRSGTTWLARLLARSPGTALAGREPMNPRGRQYALGKTLDGWAKLVELTPRQRFLLRTAYNGQNPFVYSRFGQRQWAGPLPWTRLVVKDPYAMLSMPVVAAATGAVPVLVYRHPGAILASYRRVTWRPRVDEVAKILDGLAVDGQHPVLPDLPAPGEASPAEEMGLFWSALHELALADVTASGAVVVSHAELATGGAEAGRTLTKHLGLAWSPAMSAEFDREPSRASAGSTRLHNFDRAPATVAEDWRSKLTDLDVQQVERVASGTLAKVEAARLRLPG